MIYCTPREIPQAGELWFNSSSQGRYEIERVTPDAEGVPQKAVNANNDGSKTGPQVVYRGASQKLFHRSLDEFMGTRWDGVHYVYRFVKVPV